jgi:CheY-like chemotaxis protein
MNPAAGIRVLIVEDEPIVAMLAEDLLDSIGCVIAGTAASIAEARHAIETIIFDVALIDVNLDGEDGLIVADALKVRRIPYVITSGYEAEGLAPGHPDAPVLSKPYAIAALEAAICRSVT